MDLRAEPIVVTMPKVEKSRYYSGQLIDLYTFNFAYLGTRSYGNDGGDFLVAGPGWNGDAPRGIKAVLHSETEFAYILFRTQVFDPSDLGNVKKIQAGYRAQPLSKFLGEPAPNPAPAVNWPAPTPDMLTSPAMFSYLNFMLQFCPTNPSEKDLMERFTQCQWPGNVRQLENVVKRYLILNSIEVGADEMATVDATDTAHTFDLKRVGRRAADQAEREVVLRVLDETEWNRKECANTCAFLTKPFATD